jgi:hypothetical protein
MSYSYAMEFYPGIITNEILSFAGKWMDVENIILSEVSQIRKAKSLMFIPLIQILLKKSQTKGWSHMIEGWVKEGS